MSERIVISGLGVLSPNGVDKDAFRDGLRAGKSGIRNINHMDCARINSKVAGYVDDAVVESLVQDKETLEKYDRTTIFALIAAQRAGADAKFDQTDAEGLKVGLVMGSSVGSIGTIEDLYRDIFAHRKSYLAPSEVSKLFMESPQLVLARYFQMKALSMVVSNSCDSSMSAISSARLYLAAGVADLLFVGGVDCPVLPEYMRMMDALRVLTRDFNDDPATACRPFDRRRSGMVLAEGCGFLVIERESTAVQRNAEIYGEILGIGQSQCVTSGPEGRSASMASAMLTAMEDAELSPEDIQHIQAHGDSSPEGDLAEAQAIMQVFGSQTASVPVSSVKSMTGHTMGASGAISMIAELLAMRNNFMVPTINMDERDPKIALDVVANQVRQQPYDTAMVNSFGRDGGNISVIIRKV